MDTSFKLFPDQASTLAPRVDALYFFLLAVTVFFTLLIAGLIIFFALKYRRKNNVPPPDTYTDRRLELLWTVVPLILTMIMFVWAARVFVAQSRVPDGAMEIHVIGKQWMWKIQHPDGRREIDELTVPTGRPIKLVMTSQDVIHSFFIPAFRIKQDVVPGRYNYEWFEATKPGVYHLFCAEYCGAQHSGMIGRVVVLKPADYQRWLAGAPEGEEAPEVAGGKLFAQYSCNTCHGSRAPTMAGLYGSQVQVLVGDREQTVTADEDYLRESIYYPRAKIVKGFAPELMPSYQGQLSEEQLMQIIAYIKSLGAGATPGAGGQRMDPGTKMQELRKGT
jgi:cytochrome c oxidase subunit 2